MRKNPVEEKAGANLHALCDDAIESAKSFECETFSVQTLFSKKELAKEDEYFDSLPLHRCMAAKNLLNAKAAKYIQKKSGKKYSREPDVILGLDFANMRAEAKPQNIFIFGRYLKKSREYCQHLWACSACRGRGCKKCDFKKENYLSIEGSLAKIFAPAFEATGAKLHASGREDVDVMNLGTGRPFILELSRPKKRKVALEPLAREFGSKFPLEALGLHFCPAFWVEAICTSHFDKHYRASVSCASRPLTDADFGRISSKIPSTLCQRTPIRVAARRADLLRHRRIYSLQLHNLEDGKLSMDLWAEAGTYIKEFVHGDEGRTVPSVSSILREKCSCERLDVMGIDDGFIKTLRKY